MEVSFKYSVYGSTGLITCSNWSYLNLNNKLSCISKSIWLFYTSSSPLYFTCYQETFKMTWLTDWHFGFCTNGCAFWPVVSCSGSFLVSLPVPLYTRTLVGEWFGPQIFCTEIFPTTTHKKAFILYNFLAVYMLPLVTICVCYLVMLYQMGRPAVEPVDNNYQVRSFVKPKGCVYYSF